MASVRFRIENKTVNNFVFNCPRCKVLKTTFDLVFSEVRSPAIVGKTAGTVVGVCRYCTGGILIDVVPIPHSSTKKTFVHFDSYWWEPENVFPPPNRLPVSDLLPNDVRQVMAEAEQALDGASPRIARGAFRTVLDVATKRVVSASTTIEEEWKLTKSQTLYNRIEFLARNHLLTPALKDWAHGVRGITNEDIHTVENVTAGEAQEIAEITRMILVYLFEMPERVRLAKEAAEAKKQPASEALPAPPTGQP